MFDVVIPARNEAPTVGAIVETFVRHRKIGRVIVVVDDDTTDETALVSQLAGAAVARSFGVKGKGQCITLGLTLVSTPFVIFCDADYRDLTGRHVSQLCRQPNRLIQVIGIPEIPFGLPPNREWSWPLVSGIRRVPAAAARMTDLHGYLMEVQLNHECVELGIPTFYTILAGLTSEYKMTDQRKAERDRDYRWGQEHGMFPPWRRDRLAEG